jgi:two-component sensor histidine kinase
LHRSSTLEQFEEAFMGRVQALARAYELLSRDGWKSVAIADLLRTQLSPFADDRRYCAKGDDVMLTADAALGFGLALYELATNATKYGALSVPSGRVEVRWRVESAPPREYPEEGGATHRARNLIFEWVERDGPEVNAPTRRGFGSELIERQLKYELDGKTAMTFDKAGLRVTLTVPISDAIQVLRSQPAQ